MDQVRSKLKSSKTLVGPFSPFHIEDADESPYLLFLKWYQEALEHGIHEPHSMTLSTVGVDGTPDARVLILKDVDAAGWYFASSANSMKGIQLHNNPGVALTFYWSMIGKQVRIRGTAVSMNRERSAEDFLNRGTVARAIALIDKQSSILEQQQDFDIAVTEQLDRIEHNPYLLSPSWTLYRVEAHEVEFWQADQERKHTRLKYQLQKGRWTKNLLWA